MARKRIPDNAFERYLAMGASRSYRALAEELGLSKKAITRHAVRDGWADRLMHAESEASAQAQERAVSDITTFQDKYTKLLHLIQAKALAVLKSAPAMTAADATKALITAIREERNVLGLKDESEDAAAHRVGDADIAAERERLMEEYHGWHRGLFFPIEGQEDLQDLLQALFAYEREYRAEAPWITAQEFRAEDRTPDFLRWVSQSEEAEPCLLDPQ